MDAGVHEAAVLKPLRVEDAADPGALYQMAKTALAVLEMDRAQVVAVQLHEVERPQHQVILDALVHAPVQLLKSIHVHELGIDDGGSAG